MPITHLVIWEYRAGAGGNVRGIGPFIVSGGVWMDQGVTPTEAVRLALEMLQEANPQEIATYVKEKFGLALKPPIVSVLLGSLEERERLTQRGQVVREAIERWKEENPEEAKKLAAQAKRRAARQKPAETGGPE